MPIDAIQNTADISRLINAEGINSHNSIMTDGVQANENIFFEKIFSLDESLKKSDSLAERYIKGENIPVHDLMISMGKAKTELQLVIEIRNKLLEAYQEISRIQL